MKKILGISLVAVLAATPLMAGATDLTEGQMAKATITTADSTTVAATAYVKGAYTELGTAINTKADKTALAAETERATTAEEALAGRLTTAEGDITKLNAADTVVGSVDYKIKTAIDTVNADASTLAGRVTTAEGKITTLEGNVVDNATAISAEETRAKGVESGLDTRLTTAEGDITKLNAADTVVGSVDYKIKTAIDTVNTAASTLAGRVTTAESDIDSLEGRMNTAESDINNAEAAIDLLNGNDTTAGSVAYAVKAEETRATQAETALGTRIDNLNTSMTGDFAKKTGVTATITASTIAGTVPVLATWGDSNATTAPISASITGATYTEPVVNPNTGA